MGSTAAWGGLTAAVRMSLSWVAVKKIRFGGVPEEL